MNGSLMFCGACLLFRKESLPGESQGQGSPVGCRLWGHTESDMTEATWQQQQQHSMEDMV